MKRTCNFSLFENRCSLFTCRVFLLLLDWWHLWLPFRLHYQSSKAHLRCKKFIRIHCHKKLNYYYIYHNHVGNNLYFLTLETHILFFFNLFNSFFKHKSSGLGWSVFNRAQWLFSVLFLKSLFFAMLGILSSLLFSKKK